MPPQAWQHGATINYFQALDNIFKIFEAVAESHRWPPKCRNNFKKLSRESGGRKSPVFGTRRKKDDPESLKKIVDRPQRRLYLAWPKR
jgi:DNA-binding transcriptional regulator GbsR (MarR family)